MCFRESEYLLEERTFAIISVKLLKEIIIIF